MEFLSRSWKVMEFDNLDSRPGKSWNFCPGHGKSWNLITWIPGLESHGIFVQVMEFDVGKYVRSTAAYCFGLGEMYAGKQIKLR